MAILAGIGAAVGIGTSIANTIGQYKQMNYQKEMQQEAWRREDNAVQRRVADLDAAGLSPTLAAGSSASASSPISIGAPDHGDIQGNIKGAREMVAMQKSIAKTEADTLRTNAERAKVALESDKLELENKRTALDTDIVKRDFDIVKGDTTGKLYKRNTGVLSEFLDVANTILDKIGYNGPTKLNFPSSSKPVNSAGPVDAMTKVLTEEGIDPALASAFSEYIYPYIKVTPDMKHDELQRHLKNFINLQEWSK